MTEIDERLIPEVNIGTLGHVCSFVFTSTK